MPKDFEYQIYTVSELTKEIKLTLEENFSKISVIGEISNFKAHISGHWYFNLKDSEAVISCTMWKGFNNFVYFTPQDGMKVILNGKLTVYPARGNYQIDVRSMKPAGLGELQAAFEKLKQKLESEGMFDEIHKKDTPSFPQKIGIITAEGSAAQKDMISVARRRYPAVELLLAHSPVQGSGAAEAIVKRIGQLNKRKDIDLIIMGRGGGSIEDLWAFNEEIVARAIFKSKIPVITGIGHEIDFTIADYVADLRAPTPSVAMELATPDINELAVFITNVSNYFSDRMKKIFDNALESMKVFTHSYAYRYPIDLVRKQQQKVDYLTVGILRNIDARMLSFDGRLSLFSKTLEIMNIERTLKRGFVLVRQNSNFITMAKGFNKDKSADLQFIDGVVKVNT